MRRFLIVFIALLAASFGFELTPFAQAYVVTPWTDAIAHVSGELMRAFDSSIATRGNVIGSKTSAFAVSIEAGCNGLEATLVLIAAIVAFPAPWRHRLRGIALGVLAVQAAHRVRIPVLKPKSADKVKLLQEIFLRWQSCAFQCFVSLSVKAHPVAHLASESAIAC